MYLTPTDYLGLSTTQDKEILTEDSTVFLLENLENSARELISSYLRGYRAGEYDLNAIFPLIYKWDITKAYVPGTLVYDEVTLNNGTKWNNVYKCLYSNTAQNPNTPSIYWAKEDTRNALIVRVQVEIVLYDLYTRIMPDNIPAIRKERYEYALEWLKGLPSGNTAPNLPTIVVDNGDGGSSTTVDGFFTKGNLQNWNY